MSCSLMQQIFVELGGRDGLGSYFRDTTLNCQQPRSRSRTLKPDRFKSPANQVELKRVTDNSGQISSIYAYAIRNADLSIPNENLAIPLQTAFRLSI